MCLLFFGLDALFFFGRLRIYAKQHQGMFATIGVSAQEALEEAAFFFFWGEIIYIYILDGLDGKCLISFLGGEGGVWKEVLNCQWLFFCFFLMVR